MKKKNLFSLVALATLTLGSCTNDEVVNDYSQDNAIQFGTYMGRDVQGRGEILTTNNLADFGVFAAYTGQTDWASSDDIDFMFNQEVSKPDNATAETKWTYSPLKYWPTTQGDKISFFAYAPYEGKVNGAIKVKTEKNGTGIPEIAYTINPDYLTEAEDFVADVLYNQVKQQPEKTDNDGSDEIVTFSLNHELTRVSIGAKLDRDAFVDNDEANQTKINIKNIEFGGTSFPLEATYKFATENDVEGADGAAVTIKRGTWTFADGAKNKTLNIGKLLNKTTPDLGGYDEPGIQLENDNEAVPLFNDGQYLFLIPTNGEDGLAADGDITITVEYDIVTIDSELSAGHSVTSATKKINLPEDALMQGKAYAYTLIFNLNEIVLKATVADWGKEDTWDGYVDWNDEDVTITVSE